MNWNWNRNNTLMLIPVLLLTLSCQSIPFIKSHRQGDESAKGKPNAARDSKKSLEPDDDYEYEQPAPSTDSQSTDSQDPQPESNWTGQTPIVPPRALPKIPKIGIIVGPGFLRSYIAAGILSEFQKARIPIHALVGLEWGSLPAALFALNGQGSEVEWQMMKLHESDFFKTSLMGGAVETQSTSAFQSALDTILNRKAFEQNRIPFECLSFDVKQKQFFWMRKGEMSRALPYCLASPPFFSPHLNNISGYNLKLAADALRKKGVNYIILINTLSSTRDYVTSSMDATSRSYWALMQNQLLSARGLVDEVIETSKAPYSVLDFESRREMIREGQSLGAEAAAKLAQKLKI